MARRKGGSDITVDIFNFLGVVKNLLGVLMVIIIGLAVGASESSGSGPDSGEGEDVAATQEAAETRPAQPTPREVEIPDGYTATEAQDLVDMIAQAIVVQKLVKASADHPDPAKELKVLLDEISILSVKLKQLRDEAKLKDIAPAAPMKYEVASSKAPGNTGASHFHPAYIECTDYALLIHPLPSATETGVIRQQNIVLREGEGLLRIRKADIDGPRFRRFLETLKENGANGVLFLIRPEGVLTFRLAQTISDELKVHSERLAVPGFEPIDLGMFGVGG